MKQTITGEMRSHCGHRDVLLGLPADGHAQLCLCQTSITVEVRGPEAPAEDGGLLLGQICIVILPALDRSDVLHHVLTCSPQLDVPQTGDEKERDAAADQHEVPVVSMSRVFSR